MNIFKILVYILFHYCYFVIVFNVLKRIDKTYHNSFSSNIVCIDFLSRLKLGIELQYVLLFKDEPTLRYASIFIEDKSPKYFPKISKLF